MCFIFTPLLCQIPVHRSVCRKVGSIKMRGGTFVPVKTGFLDLEVIDLQYFLSTQHTALFFSWLLNINIVESSKGVPRQAEVAQVVPGRLRPRIILTFRHYKGGSSSAKRTAAFTPGEIPGSHRGWVDLRANGSVGGVTEKIPRDNTGNRTRNRPTSSAVP